MSTNHSAASRATQTGPSPRVAPTLSTLSGTGAMASAPARVDEIIMPGAHARIVGRQDHGQRRHVRRHDPPVPALRGADIHPALPSVPFHLARARTNDG